MHRLLLVPLVLVGAVALMWAWINRPRPETGYIRKKETLESLYRTDAAELYEAGGIVIQHAYIPYDSRRRPGEIREIRYLTIHETDNRSPGADAEAHSLFLQSGHADLTGWHYTVDDHSIYHHLPDNEIAWNAGDQRTRDGGNINGIGIEMCVNIGNSYQKTIENTARLCAALLREYDLTPEDVRLHQDFMNKVCPHRMITENRVYEFYDLVRSEYEALAPQVTGEE